MPDYEFYEGASTGAQIDEEVQEGCLWVNCGTVSSLPFTKIDSNILASHLPVRRYVASPVVQVSDWTVETADGSLTISGEINGSSLIRVALVRTHSV